MAIYTWIDPDTGSLCSAVSGADTNPSAERLYGGPAAREILRLAASPESCVWTACENDGEVNGMRFCCYCGHPLQEQPWREIDGRDEDGLTDAEADAQTLEGVYGPEE